MDNAKMEKLGKQFIFNNNVKKEDFALLEIQDIVFLIFTTQAINEKKAIPNFDAKGKLTLFAEALISKMKSAKELYVAYDRNTKCPYIDFNGRAWIFSKSDFAQKAKEHFETQNILLDIKELKGQDVLNEFVKFHHIGIEKAIVDNGQYNTEILRNSIVPPLDYSKIPAKNIPVMNAKLQFAIISFFQTAYSKKEFDGKGKLLQAIENTMLSELIKGRYLVPIKIEKDAPVDSGKDPKYGFAVIRDKNDKRWLPMFTDWEEFGKAFNRKECSANICTFNDIFKLISKMDGAVLNCNGLSLKIDENNKKKIEEFIAKQDK